MVRGAWRGAWLGVVCGAWCAVRGAWRVGAWCADAVAVAHAPEAAVARWHLGELPLRVAVAVAVAEHALQPGEGYG